MGKLVAVLTKMSDDAADAVVRMLKTVGLNSVEAYGVASPSAVKIDRSLKDLRLEKACSTAVGYAFSGMLNVERPQPLKLPAAALVFDGSIYGGVKDFGTSERFVARLAEGDIEGVRKLMLETDGDYSFTMAAPRKLVAGRDPLGVRPLYYSENSAFAALASERKALWRLGLDNVRSFYPGHLALVSDQGFEFEMVKTLTHVISNQITMRAASRRLRTLMEHAVSKRVSGLKHVAVAFSGGLDSSLIAVLARKTGIDVELIHVSLGDKVETNHAEKMAAELKLPIHCFMYTEDDVLRTVPETLYLIEEPNPVKVSIGIPIYWAAKKSADMGFEVMLAGQGSDEFFAGYRRYVDAYLNQGKEQVKKMIFHDIAQIHEDNLERDFKVCSFHGVEIRLPFADFAVAQFSLGLPIELKIERSENTLRKLVLRQMARDLKLPDAIVNRPKKALQYATGVDNALKRIARREKVKVKDYLNQIFQDEVMKMMADG